MHLTHECSFVPTNALYVLGRKFWKLYPTFIISNVQEIFYFHDITPLKDRILNFGHTKQSVISLY